MPYPAALRFRRSKLPRTVDELDALKNPPKNRSIAIAVDAEVHRCWMAVPIGVKKKMLTDVRDSLLKSLENFERSNPGYSTIDLGYHQNQGFTGLGRDFRIHPTRSFESTSAEAEPSTTAHQSHDMAGNPGASELSRQPGKPTDDEIHGEEKEARSNLPPVNFDAWS